jgi:hypothetical protein
MQSIAQRALRIACTTHLACALLALHHLTAAGRTFCLRFVSIDALHHLRLPKDTHV